MPDLLTAEEEVDLAHRRDQGDECAVAILVERNQALVGHYAKPYLRRFPSEIEDILAAGMMGLLLATRRFDPDRGVRFATFAVWWIKHDIREHCRNNIGLVRVPQYLQNRSTRAWNEANVAAAGRALAFRVGAIANAHEASCLLAELPSRVEPDNHDALLLERLPTALASLPAKQQYVLRHRFGLNGQEPMTLAELAVPLRVTRERVRQIEMKARAALRSALERQSCPQPR